MQWYFTKSSRLLLFLVCIIGLHCGITAQTLTPRALLIFLDETEKNIDAISSSLIAALAQKAAPLVATQSLVQNIFSGYPPATSQSDADTVKNFNSIMRAIAWNPISVTPEMQQKLKGYFQRALEPLMSEWIIKEIAAGFYLFLPTAIIPKEYSPTTLAQDAPLSELELALGLKIDHMGAITLDEILTKAPVSGKSFLDDVLAPNKNNSALFCMRRDYAGKKQATIPTWGIYMKGHGKMRESIAGIPLEDFKKVLAFFSGSINTALLIYQSCYAAGLNTEIIFKTETATLQQNYPFPIITQAITDAPVMELSTRVAIINSKLGIESFTDLASFVAAITTNSFSDYRKITEYLFPLLPKEEISLPRWANVPQIKLPGIEWFSVLASQKDIVAIGRTLAQSRAPSQPFSIQFFFKTDPKALLIYAPTVPFEIILDGKNLEAIISMIPSDAIHIFEKISTKKSVSEVVALFGQSIYMLDARKVFLIKQLNDAHKNVVIHNIKKPGIPGISSDVYTVEAFFEKDSDVYYAAIDPIQKISFSAATALQKDTYKRLLSEALGTINIIEGYSFESDTAANNFFKPIQSSTIIKKITGIKKATIAEIFLGISSKRAPQAAVLIEEMSAPYDNFEIAIPGKKNGEIVIIRNVLVGAGPIYFQYDGKFYKGKGVEVASTEYDEKYKEAFGSAGTIEPDFPYKKIEEALRKRDSYALASSLTYLAEAVASLPHAIKN